MRSSLSMLTVVLLFLVPPSDAEAESWCASPLDVHEWGVQAFDGAGTSVTPTLPSWFHRRAGAGNAAGPPARSLPADGGERALPVLHFYGRNSMSSPVPLGIEVGFRHGRASHWYPQVDALRTGRPSAAPQLTWERLNLHPEATHTPHVSTTPWVDELRGFDALWVNGARESERFVFYEGSTREQVAIRIERGPEWRADHRHLVLHNRSTHPVHDVFLTHREGGRVYVIFAPTIPAGRSAGFVLESHQQSAGTVAAATRDRLRARIIDTAPPPAPDWANECVMMRDPATPFRASEGHRLYPHEVDAVLNIWAGTFFDRPGTTVTYREDTAYLDHMMPLALYTDMMNFVRLRRLGLAVWTGVSLP